MSDTRTIYLKNNEGTIYSSDPSNVGYEYLNISDFDSLNPSENSIFTSATNISLMYSSYDVKLVLTFVSNYDNGRQARAVWVAKNQNSINQISVANTNNPDLIFSKQAKIKTIDFIENPYVNGVQAELTLELAGRWQSSVKRTSATVYPYTGGTKKYNYHYSTLDRSLLINRNYVLNSSGMNATPTVRPTLIGATSGANVTVTYQSDGVLMTNGATNTTNEWYYQVASAWTNFSDTLLTPGESITFSADVMGTVPQAVLSYGFSGMGGRSGSKNFDINNTSWTRVSITVTSTSTNTGLYFRIQGGINNQYATGWSGGETLKFRYVKIADGNTPTTWTPAPEDTNPKPTYKYGYQVITDEVVISDYNGFIINIPSQTTPVNVTLTAPSGLSATLTTSQTNVPLQISSDMIGYSLDNFDTFTLLNKGFPASKYWDNLLSVYSTIQTILNADTVTVSVASNTGSTIPFEFYLYKLQDLI